jgi:hypothetical protein
MRTRPNAEVDVRRRNRQLLEEHIRHVDVVMLPRMHQDLLDTAPRTERAMHRRYLHEVRTSAHDMQNLHRLYIKTSSFGIRLSLAQHRAFSG